MRSNIPGNNAGNFNESPSLAPRKSKLVNRRAYYILYAGISILKADREEVALKKANDKGAIRLVYSVIRKEDGGREGELFKILVDAASPSDG